MFTQAENNLGFFGGLKVSIITYKLNSLKITNLMVQDVFYMDNWS